MNAHCVLQLTCKIWYATSVKDLQKITFSKEDCAWNEVSNWGFVRDAGAPVYLINLKPFRYPYQGKSPVLLFCTKAWAKLWSQWISAAGPCSRREYQNEKHLITRKHIAGGVIERLLQFPPCHRCGENYLATVGSRKKQHNKINKCSSHFLCSRNFSWCEERDYG